MWKMMALVFYFVTLALLNATLATESHVCGFSGIPYGGRTEPNLEEWRMGKMIYTSCSRFTYKVGQTIHYDCYAPGRRFRLEGSDHRSCQEHGWEGDLPQCVENAAFKRSARISDETTRCLTDGLKDPITESAVCQSVPNSHSVRLDLGRPCLLKEIDIYFQNDQVISSSNNDVVIIEISGKTTQCHRNHSLPADRISNYIRYSCSVSHIEVDSETSVKFISSSKINLLICEIEVYVNQKDECGYPEIPANGLVSMPFGRRKVTYNCSSGYQLDGPKERNCVNGQWTEHTPHCKPISREMEISYANINDDFQAESLVQKDTQLNHRIDNLDFIEIMDKERNKVDYGKMDVIDEFEKEISSVSRNVEIETKALKSTANNLLLVILMAISFSAFALLLVFVFLFVIKKDLGKELLVKFGIQRKKPHQNFSTQEEQPLTTDSTTTSTVTSTTTTSSSTSTELVKGIGVPHCQSPSDQLFA